MGTRIGSGGADVPLFTEENAIFVHIRPTAGAPQFDRLLVTATYATAEGSGFVWGWTRMGATPGAAVVLPIPADATLVSVDVEAFAGEQSVWWSGFGVGG